jgi:hypothetical protein
MTRRYVKHTKESLEPVVVVSRSIREVLARLGLRETGGSHRNIKDRIKEYEIDTTHFLGQGHNKGTRARNRKTSDEILRCGNFGEPKINVFRLRRALDDIGRKRVCQFCGIEEWWNNKPLRLQIDHVNGRRWDNRQENLRYLCPNCHSQTETFGVKNNKRECIPTAEEIGREPIQ